ncbi:MAG: peptide-methionine (S)-S-oxide reductase MsrA [Hyphomicrobiales bacterium]|nr:peptide-methionine (S)-S-oxide reductase MsrA [Hyphomicrobiales bacterium]MBV9518255.1 peptide-methionine (S)-S-oxide reductase MsrA [Hyphomicrobiales bacterium]
MIRTLGEVPLSRFRMAIAVFAAISFLSWWVHGNETSMPTANAKPGIAVATFAGGCLWCLQPTYDALQGVISTTPGYTGGTKPDPTDEEVLDGETGHANAIEVVFDPSKITYEKLLDIFWHNIDPLTENAQFCDHGTQYRTAIFYHDEAQKRLAKAAKAQLEAGGVLTGPIVTQITKAGTFFPVKDYRRESFDKNSAQYMFYRNGCGRDARLRQIWGAAAAID